MGKWDAESGGRRSISAARLLVSATILTVSLGATWFLAGCAVFSAASSAAQQKQCFANQRTVNSAVQVYIASNPGTTTQQLSGPVNASNPIVGFAIKNAPVCPLGPNPYVVDGATGLTTCPYGDAPAGHGAVPR